MPIIKFPRRILASSALTAAVAAALVACGGGGGGGTTSSSGLSGRIVDGYIGGATVCLDVNANLACDSGEPTTTSGKDGSYTLPAYAGSIDGLQVIAVVPAGATDSELGVITKPFDLFAPAESASMVTPLTTLVANDMATRKVSAAEAEKTILAQFNLPTTSLLGVDPTKSSDLLKVAQVVTAAIASSKEALADLNTKGSLGLDRAAIVKAAIAEVKTSVLPQVLGSDGKVAIDISGKNQGELVALIATTANVATQLQGKVEQIVSRSKTGDGAVMSMAEAFKKGLVISQLDSGDYLDSQGVRKDGSWGGFSDSLVVEYVQFDIDKDTQPTEFRKVWVNGTEGLKWYTTYDNDATELRYFFDGSQWQKAVGAFFSNKPSISGNCMTVPVIPGASLGQKVCGVARDLSGKKMSDFLRDSSGKSLVCKDQNGNTIAGCDPNQLFPAGSIGYDLTISVTGDFYEIWTGEDSWVGYNYQGLNWNNPAATTPTIDKFITALKSSPQWTGSGCSVGFRVKSSAADGKSGVMEWGENVSKSCSGAKVNAYTETTSFTVKTVGGKEVLSVFYPNLYRKLNPGDGMASEKIFTIVEKEVALNGSKTKIQGIFAGDFQKESSQLSIPFTGNLGASFQVSNKTLFEAALKARGLTSLPYNNN